MFGPYCLLRSTSRTAGFASQIANRSFNFAVRDAEPDLEPSAVWSSEQENEFYGAFGLIYPIRVDDLPRTLTHVWIRASWRPAHASIVWPMDGAWCHIAIRPPRGTSVWQYEFGDQSVSFTSPHPSRLPMTLRQLGDGPAVAWLEEFRAQRANAGENNDPDARSSSDIPGGDSPRIGENPVNDSTSRISSGIPDPEPHPESPMIDPRAGKYSPNAVRNTVRESSESTPRLEPVVDQDRELLMGGRNPSVSYLRSLFGNHGAPSARTTLTHFTNGELFSIEVAAGEEEIEPPISAARFDHYVVRLISAYAFFPRRDSSDRESGDIPRHADLYERATASRGNPH